MTLIHISGFVRGGMKVSCWNPLNSLSCLHQVKCAHGRRARFVSVYILSVFRFNIKRSEIRYAEYIYSICYAMLNTGFMTIVNYKKGLGCSKGGKRYTLDRDQ